MVEYWKEILRLREQLVSDIMDAAQAASEGHSTEMKPLLCLPRDHHRSSIDLAVLHDLPSANFICQRSSARITRGSVLPMA